MPAESVWISLRWTLHVGMTSTLIGRDGDAEIMAPAIADQAQSITNELLSRMGTRVVVREI